MTRPLDPQDVGPAGWGSIPTLGSLGSSTGSGTSPSATQTQQAATSTAQAAVAKDALITPFGQWKFVQEDGTPTPQAQYFHEQIRRKIGNFQTDAAKNTPAVPNPATTPSALASYGYTQAQADALITLAINLATRVTQLEQKLGLQG